MGLRWGGEWGQAIWSASVAMGVTWRVGLGGLARLGGGSVAVGSLFQLGQFRLGGP